MKCLRYKGRMTVTHSMISDLFFRLWTISYINVHKLDVFIIITRIDTNQNRKIRINFLFLFFSCRR